QAEEEWREREAVRVAVRHDHPAGQHSRLGRGQRAHHRPAVGPQRQNVAEGHGRDGGPLAAVHRAGLVAAAEAEPGPAEVRARAQRESRPVPVPAGTGTGRLSFWPYFAVRELNGGRLNGRGYTVGRNGMKAGLVGTILPPLANTLNCGPSPLASLFSAAGLVTAAPHCPVLTRLRSSCTAVRVSAGVNAQCPA